MLSKLLVILVCILAVSSEARLHGRRRLSRSGHKIRRLMNQASPRCAAMLMDGCQYQCADQANPQQCTTCVEGNVLTNYDELVKQGCVEPPKMDKCSAITMDGCLGLCTRGNTPECNECATRNAMNNQAELMENGCINRNRRLFRTADEAPQMCCQSMSPSCVACRRDEMDESVGNHWGNGHSGRGPSKFNPSQGWWDEMDESVGSRKAVERL